MPSASTTLTDEAGVETVYLSRKEFAEKAGISVSEVRRRERLGEFAPAKRICGSRRVAQYTVDQVQMMKKLVVKQSKGMIVKYDSDDSYRVCHLIAQGKSVSEVLLETKLHPHAVKAILSDYSEISGSLFLNNKQVERINALPLDGNFPVKSGEDVVLLLEGAAKEDCERCGRRAKRYCKTCTPLVARSIDSF